MDEIDRDIAMLLYKNGRASATTLSAAVCLSPSAVSARIKKLEGDGVILGYSADVRPDAMGYAIESFILVTLDSSRIVDEFREAAIANEMVDQLHHLAGEYDYLLHVYAEGSAQLEDFISGALRAMPGVSRIVPIISISRLK